MYGEPMTFRFRVTAVEYDEGFGETVLIGELESGRLGGGAHIRIPTASGIFASRVVSMEGGSVARIVAVS